MPLDQTPHIGYDDDDKEDEESDNDGMSFLDHLEELRWHLIRSAIAIAIFMVIGFVFHQEVFQMLILPPSKVDFITYRVLCDIGNAVGIESLCVEKMNFALMSREVSGQFMMALTTAAIVGLVVAFPYIFWEIWRFIKPGLKKEEKGAARGAVFYVTLLFFMGVLFGYYVVAPFAINFLVNFQIDESIINQFDIGSYIGILATLTLACGITFQLPIAIFVLTKIGVVTPLFLRTYRRHSLVVILIVAAVITPSPDAISQILVSIPLYILFEISILVSERVEKARLATLEG
ncbi:MAG: sec-independent protein translocase protein TatC [Spirosomataceae bacterium]|jgi:sec-independent protein translocase protein TatC